MPFGHRATHSFPQDTPMDDQIPTSPMDAEFTTVPPTPMDTSLPEDPTIPMRPIHRTTTATFTAQPIPTTPTTEATPYASSSSSSSSSLSQLQQQQQQQLFARSVPFSLHRAARTAEDAAFREKLRQMALPLAPLVQLTTGEVHSSFPPTLLAFWLLTDAELESLAHFYHQRTPCRWTYHYPCPVAWDSRLGLEEKRRRLGKFIGLRGCETPVLAVAADATEDELLAEARRARAMAEEEVWRRKLPWY